MRPEIYRRAERQYGLITTQQLREIGVSDPAISRLVASGALIRVYRSVFRLPGAQQSIHQRALAASLACSGFACGVTAAALWGLLEALPRGPVHILVALSRNPSHNGVVVHRTKNLPKIETTSLGPIPITRVKRTIRDLPRALQEEALDEAIRQRRVSPKDFVEDSGYLGRLAKDRLGLGVPHEKIEREAVAVLRRAKLPPPKRQHWVAINGERYRIDLAYPDRKIAIELLGEAAHWGRVRFQSDIDRRNALEIDGWRQIDFSWFDVTRDEAKVVKTVTALLADQVFDRVE